VLAFVAGGVVTGNDRPVLASLTALLVVQLTLYDTLRSGLRRVASVVAGVLVAVAVSVQVELNAWTLGAVVAASLVLGRLMRLGAEALEVPISAMLVLAVASPDTAATGRVVETVVGALVGVLVNAVVAPPLYLRPASDAVQSVARTTAAVVRLVADEVAGPYTRDQAAGWLEAARGVGRDVLRADRALGQAEESLRLNPRARNRPHARASLRSGLDALERVSVSLRGVCRSLMDRAESEGPEPVYAKDVRLALSDVLRHVAEAVEAYGGLVGAEVLDPGSEDRELRDALSRAWAARHRLAALLREGDRLHAGAWELPGALAAHIDRLLRDIDGEARSELRKTWPRRAPRARRRAGRPPRPAAAHSRLGRRHPRA
jgi:hypothetical protein